MSTPEARTRILDAAEKAFAEVGFAGARVAGIAAEADVNKAMLYYYFGNKEELYVAVLERIFDQVAVVAAAALADSAEDPIHSLDDFLEGYRSVLWSRPQFARLLMREVLDGAPHLFKVIGPRLGVVLPAMRQAVEQGQAGGKVNPALDPLVVGPAMVAPFIFFAVAHPLISQITGLPFEALSETYARTAKEVVLHGVQARPEEDA